MNGLLENNSPSEEKNLSLGGVGSQTRHASKQEQARVASDISGQNLNKAVDFNVEIKYKNGAPFFGKTKNFSNVQAPEIENPRQVSNLRKHTSQNDLSKEENMKTQNSFGIISPGVNSSVIMTVIGKDKLSPDSKNIINMESVKSSTVINFTSPKVISK